MGMAVSCLSSKVSTGYKLAFPSASHPSSVSAGPLPPLAFAVEMEEKRQSDVPLAIETACLNCASPVLG